MAEVTEEVQNFGEYENEGTTENLKGIQDEGVPDVSNGHQDEGNEGITESLEEQLNQVIPENSIEQVNEEIPENVKVEPEDYHAQSIDEHKIKDEQEGCHPEDFDEHKIKDEPEDPEVKQEHEHQPVQDVNGGGERWPGFPGESVFRMLIPAQKVGSLIGRKGEYIKKITEETKARIKVLDGPPGTGERAVMVSAKEDPDASHPSAINGILKVHQRVVDGLDNDSAHPPPGTEGLPWFLFRARQEVLLENKVLQSRLFKKDQTVLLEFLEQELPVFALQDDRIVEVIGEPEGVHKAVELIASQLRKFLVDRSIIPIIESQMQMPHPQMERVPPPQSWGPPPQGFFPSSVGGQGFGAPHFRPPHRQHESYYPPVEMPPSLEKQHHQGISTYGREPSMAILGSSNQPTSSRISQITQHMQVPLSYADAVIGSGGANISYIRRISGATVTIQESRGAPGEMTVEISGTASQVQTAQQMIQNSMTEAAGQSQAQGGAVDQGYNSYGAQGNLYASAASNAGLSGQAAGYGSTTTNAGGYGSATTNAGLSGQAGGYGTAYGANYGY
ncbi:hypothetical protein Leryth_001495 [Lithospermum erythrorhizon]|nr:hypothetical protein Leryth_001495 [Lithospermum erythrorhizon]